MSNCIKHLFTLMRGDDFAVTTYFKDENDDPVDITGSSFNCTMKSSIDIDDVDAEFVTEPVNGLLLRGGIRDRIVSKDSAIVIEAERNSYLVMPISVAETRYDIIPPE